MNILVTGGLGFIGSHTTIELIKNKHTVIIADNLINSKIEVLDKKKINYTEEVRKVKDANEDTKKFLDRKLPDDVKRLLNDAVSE